MVAAIDDRKIFIATGYGLEGALPDALVRRIIENDIKPYFKSGDYYSGLDKGTDQVVALAKGEYKCEGRKRKDNGNPFFVIIIFLVIGGITSGSAMRRLNAIPMRANCGGSHDGAKVVRATTTSNRTV